MPTSCNTHDYDGKLREKWFEIRPTLIEKYLKHCLSFEDTLFDMEQWLEKKYPNAKRIGRARRSMKILRTHRQSNFDRRNDIDVEELLPILWNQVKSHEDIHDTFYEQLCDVTGGSCSQGRSTRLFQFLFLFDLPISSSMNSSENRSTEVDVHTTTDRHTATAMPCINNGDDSNNTNTPLNYNTVKSTVDVSALPAATIPVVDTSEL